MYQCTTLHTPSFASTDPTNHRSKILRKKKIPESSLKAKLEFAMNWNCFHYIRCFKYSTGDLQYRDDICWLDAKTVSSYIRDLASSGCGIPRGPETNSPGIPRDDPVCKKKLVLLRQLNGLLRNPPLLLISLVCKINVDKFIAYSPRSQMKLLFRVILFIYYIGKYSFIKKLLILDSYTFIRNSSQRSPVPIPQFPPLVTSCRALASIAARTLARSR